MREMAFGFITPEIAISQVIPTYTGGLGYVAGSAMRSAYALNLPLVGITVLPSHGLYEQFVDLSGMKVRFSNWDYESVLEPTEIQNTIFLCGSPVRFKVYLLPRGRFGNVPIYFITTNVPGNDDLSRLITLQLYGGTIESGANTERKIALSYVLAKGAIEIMRCLEFDKILYHVNESHGAFIGIELIHELLDKGISFEDALIKTREQIVFTTHTIIPAGNPRYRINDIVNITGYRHEVLCACGGDPFNMAASGFYTSKHANAVSKKHAEVVKHLWRGEIDTERFTSVTNGMDRSYWQYPEFERAKKPQHVMLAKRHYKREMLRYVKLQTNYRWSENVPTCVWARRIAEYKRPNLLFFDMEWLKERLETNAFQLIYAGKPHPDDQPMIDMWNRIFELSNSIPNLVIIPNYDLELSKLLKGGADIWINTPRVGAEACGTSGMSAALNGAINVSTKDGWMCEADPENCFLFGSSIVIDANQDSFDALNLRETLDQKVLPLYFKKEKWYKMALCAIREAVNDWNSDRMIKEYSELYIS